MSLHSRLFAKRARTEVEQIHVEAAMQKHRMAEHQFSWCGWRDSSCQRGDGCSTFNSRGPRRKGSESSKEFKACCANVLTVMSANACTNSDAACRVCCDCLLFVLFSLSHLSLQLSIAQVSFRRRLIENYVGPVHGFTRVSSEKTRFLRR